MSEYTNFDLLIRTFVDSNVICRFVLLLFFCHLLINFQNLAAAVGAAESAGAVRQDGFLAFRAFGD